MDIKNTTEKKKLDEDTKTKNLIMDIKNSTEKKKLDEDAIAKNLIMDINKIVEESKPYQIIIMIQKEVADRFNAKPCTKQYGSLSVFLQYNFDIEKVCNVSKNCFEPIPKVDSTVLKLTSNKKYNVNNEKTFYKLIKDSFKQKRKNLRNNLGNYDLDKIREVLSKFNKDLTCRAEELKVEEFAEISNKISI